MNNGKLKVTKTAQAFDVSSSTIITLANTGDCDIYVGFGDLDSTFVFGDGILLNPNDELTMESSDPRFGDGTFYAVTKDTPTTQESFLSYASDGGVSPVLLATVTPLNGTLDAAIDVAPSIIFSQNIDDGVFHSLFLLDDTGTLVPGEATLVDDTYTYTPTDDLDNNALYILVRGVYDVNGKANSGMSIFTTVVGA